MPVPGYDPDDLDNELAERLTEDEIRERLSDEEFRRYENGESLVELLDSGEIEALVQERNAG